LCEEFGIGRFVTAQLATFDVTTGRLDLVSAGHPGPLLVRERHVIDLQADRPAVPLGLGDLDVGELTIRSHLLQPDDRLLFYTDGLTEARAPDGSLFGVERLVETVERARGDTHVLAEAVRRLMHTLGAFRDDVWRDDATLMMVHWTPGGVPPDE
jgi:serine phosphatase RsbU (regulator of sigma subunit)